MNLPSVQSTAEKWQSRAPLLAVTALITLVAAVLRFVHLGRESFWFDEALSVAFVRLDPAAFWKLISGDEANMALYYVLLRGWQWFGMNEVAIRSLSAVTGVLGVPVIYALARRLFGTKTGLIAALLLAVNEFAIRYSQEARAYSLVMLFVLLSSLFFVRALQSDSRADWAGYILASTLAAYCHIFAFFVLAAHLVSLAAPIPWRVRKRNLFLSGAAIAVLTAPLVFVILLHTGGALTWVQPSTLISVYWVFIELAGSRFLVGAFAACAVVALVAFVYGLVRRRVTSEIWGVGLTLSWLIVPVAITFAISMRRPMFVDRYLIVSLPALVLVMAYAVARLRSPWLIGLVVLILLRMTARDLRVYENKPVKEDWRDATAEILAQATPNDGIIFNLAPGSHAFKYYAQLAGRTDVLAEILYPPHDWDDPARPQPSLFETVAHSRSHIWLVETHLDSSTHLPVARDLRKTLAGQYASVSEHDFRGVTILYYANPVFPSKNQPAP